MKNKEAVKLGRLRWANTSKKERRKHAKMMRAVQLLKKEGVDKPPLDGLR